MPHPAILIIDSLALPVIRKGEDMEAQFWLNLQLAWDLYAVSHSPAAKGIRKIKRLIPDEITRGSGQNPRWSYRPHPTQE